MEDGIIIDLAREAEESPEISNFYGVSHDAIFLAVESRSRSLYKARRWNWRKIDAEGVGPSYGIQARMHLLRGEND